MDRGWVRLHRKIQDNALWKEKPFSKIHAWIDLTLLANWKDDTLWFRGIAVSIKRGQVGWSQVSLSERWGWSRDKVRRFMTYLVSEGQIVQQTIQQGKYLTSLITIVNYEKFNPLDTADDTADRQQTDSRQGSKNKGKKVNKVKKELYTPDFEIFWNSYPKRKGKRLGKEKTNELWQKVKKDDRLLLLTAAKNYADSKTVKDGFARDPERFFKDNYWKDWAEKPEGKGHYGGKPGKYDHLS